MCIRDRDVAIAEQLTTPHAPRLATVHCTLQARLKHRALGADALGLRDVSEVVGEEDGGGNAQLGAGGLLPPGFPFARKCLDGLLLSLF